MAMEITRKQIRNAPVRLMVLNDARTALVPVRFRADINARLDRGMPQHGIPDSWKGTVQYEGKTRVVTLIDDEWFAAECVPWYDEDD